MDTAHIVFVTTANLATNPRLVKEAELALSLDYKVSIVCFHFDNWSLNLNVEIKKRLGKCVRIIEIPAGRKPLVFWLMSTGLQLLCSLLVKAGIRSAFILSQALFKRSLLLHQTLSKSQLKPDLVIAHNPGSFFPALHFADKQKAAFGVDVEDYHPGETNHSSVNKRVLRLMKSVLPKADYCTYAAPLIAVVTKKNIPALLQNQHVILNGFYSHEFTAPVNQKTDKLQLVWFSQNIDAGRGLEHVIPVINKLSSTVKLHLIGALNENFAQQYLQNRQGIVIHPPMSQKDLHLYLSIFDAGLATDIPVNQNRDIALTNKILAYAQAGLVIAAMHTTAQDQFLKNSALLYIQMSDSEASIAEALGRLYELKVAGQLDRQRQFSIGQEYCWENVSKPLAEIWKKNEQYQKDFNH